LTISGESSVRRLSVEDVLPRPRAVPPVQTAETPLPPLQPQTSSTPDAIVATFRALGYVLSARALLLLALVFSFALAVMAMLSQTLFSLYVLLAGSAFAVLPVAYLETRRRSN